MSAADGRYFDLKITPLRVFHRDLEKLNNDSPFKVYCPNCKDGFLLVRRQDGLLSNVDNCVLCGQIVIYLDATIGGEVVRDDSRTTTLTTTTSTEPAAGETIEFDLGAALPARKVES